MALSHKSVQKAYDIFHALKETVIPQLDIRSFPEDMGKWSEEERKNPKEFVVYGWDRKSDDGWENIFFFVKKPSDDLKAVFDSLKGQIHNTSMSDKYDRNEDYWIFGWF